MSKALVKKSLELLSHDADTTNDKSKKRKKKSSELLDIIPVHHRFLSKKRKSDCLPIKRNNSKVIQQEIKRHIASKCDSTEDNVQRLLQLSSNKLDLKTMEKLTCRALKKSMESQVKEKETPKEEKSIFTEEDFKAFEAEYFKT